MGEPYTLWAVTETPEDGAIEEKDAEQTFDVSVYSNIPEEARSEVRETIDYSDEDGFAGTLTLADLTVSETAQEDGTYTRPPSRNQCRRSPPTCCCSSCWSAWRCSSSLVC